MTFFHLSSWTIVSVDLFAAEVGTKSPSFAGSNGLYSYTKHQPLWPTGSGRVAPQTNSIYLGVIKFKINSADIK